MRFHLPDPGEGLDEAEVVAWLVAPGDQVATHQPLVEIETAKSLVELPSPAAGVVGRLLVEPGTVVSVGTPLVEIDTGDVMPSAGEPDRPYGTADGTTPPVGRDGHDRTPAGTTGGSTDTELGEAEGPPVLVGYGTAPGTGLTRQSGSEPTAGAACDDHSRPDREGEPTRLSDGSTVENDGSVAGTAEGGTTSLDGSPASGSADRPRPRALAKPPVRKLAKDSGVDLDAVAGTGPGGIVTREDVLAHVARTQGRDAHSRDDAPWLVSGVVSPDGRSTRVPVRSVRRSTAEAMVASAFTAPHVTVFHTVDVTATMRLVERLRTDPEFADTRVTPLLVAAKALLLAVKRHPEINARWDGDAIVYQHYVNLGIAATTPRGLVVPNVKDAHRLGLHDLALALADLTATARAGRTTRADTTDGTITITNVGVFGIDTGTPILNPGEAAILAFGAVTQRPWVHKGKIRPRHVTQLALSFDHRLVDGELGARVLADVAAVLADPAQGLVWG